MISVGKSKKDLTKNMKMTIDMNKLELNQRKFNTSEISRGTGIHKTKKGKGSYTRKNIKYNDDYCGYNFLSIQITTVLFYSINFFS